MGTSLKVHPTNVTDNVDPGLSAKDRKQLDRLGKLWKSDAERGLKTRHLMGTVLNERVGPPARRKAHGKRVLELFGAELGIAPSDLNRMGWFSHLFPDFSDLRKRHPEIDSWTKFKTELPDLRPSKGGKARRPVANPSNPALGGVARSLANLTSKLNGLDIRPAGAERQKLVDALRRLAEAASRRLRIDVEVAVRVKESKPVVKKRLDQVARA
jgi:hypothetical protein